MSKAELLYYTDKIIQKAISNGNFPTNKTYLSAIFKLTAIEIKEVFAFAEENELFTYSITRISGTKHETRIHKKRDFSSKEKTLIDLFVKYKFSDEDQKLSVISEFINILTDKEIYEAIKISKAAFYRLKGTPPVDKDLTKRLEELRIDNWDLRMQVHSKTLELEKMKSSKIMNNYDELDNARKQVEYLVNLNDRLSKELDRLKGSVRIDNFKNLKHLN